MEFYAKSKILSGEDALSNLVHELKMKNVMRPILISEKVDEYPSFIRKAREAFDNDKLKVPYIALIKGETANADTVETIVEKCKEVNADAIVAIGRESVIDTAKIARELLRAKVKSVKDIKSICETDGDMPLAVASVFVGTATEGSNTAYMYGENEKIKFVSPNLTPEFIVIDDKLALNPHRRRAASSVMYALALSVIATIGKDSSFVSEATARAAIGFVVGAIDRLKEGTRARKLLKNIANASVLAGIAYNAVKDDILSKLSVTVSRELRIPYSKTYSMLFPHYYEYLINNDINNEERYSSVLLSLIGEERYAFVPVSRRVSDSYKEIRNIIDFLEDKSGFRYNLSDFGMKLPAIEKIAKEMGKYGEDAADMARFTLSRTY